MTAEMKKLTDLEPGTVTAGFRLEKKQYVPAKKGTLYTLRHEKCGARLLYFDRPDPNKTFAVAFKTLPEDDTGVFHILEHSVLNGSKKFPVKEPFVSLLQSSLQTFLNAYTFGDKTMFPVSSRNERDLFNLMSVYLDAVFCPSIYEKREIFMQEGWHYEFDPETGEVSYNGVVFSEMKGAYSDVERIMGEACDRLLYPDTCYRFSSGGKPENIPGLTYEKFIAAHKRFYHPSNAYFFLDGHMDVDSALSYIDGEYLSHYDLRTPDFDFTDQKPVTGSATVYFAPTQGEDRAHMVMGKLLCRFDEVEKLYAAKILADYLTGSNEAPLKRAFLEKGLAQDVSVDINDGIYQPAVALVARNTAEDRFEEIRRFVPETVRAIAEEGLDRDALHACIERFAFTCREITEPYGVELAIKALDGWLYGGDPLLHIDNAAVFDALRRELGTGYFERLLLEMLADPEDKCYVYALASQTKLSDDARRERQRIDAETAAWGEKKRQAEMRAVQKMQQWQQSQDDEQTLKTLPVLDLRDIPRTVELTPVQPCLVAGQKALRVAANTDGIVYLNLYFDVSDLAVEKLRRLNILATCLGELRTEHFPALTLQNKIKATFGSISAKLDLVSREGELKKCTPYLVVSAGVLRENLSAAADLLTELMNHTCWDETDKIGEIVVQSDYAIQQTLIGNGHSFAITKALAPFSAEDTLREAIAGESFARWVTELAGEYSQRGAELTDDLADLAKRVFTANRLFVGFGGEADPAALERLVNALPRGEMGEPVPAPACAGGDCTIEIPADVGYSALGTNLCALGGKYTGAWPVLSSMMTYGYLWNAVRVQGGAYGTGMNVRPNGGLFCYSYRDPDLPGSAQAFAALPDVLKQMLAEDIPLDDIIIGTVNTTDPLLDPASLCEVSCRRYLRGTTARDIAKLRGEILDATAADLRALLPMLRTCLEKAVFCAAGAPDAVAFVKQK